MKANDKLIYTNHGDGGEEHPGDEAIADRIAGLNAEPAAPSGEPEQEEENHSPAPSCRVDFSPDVPPAENRPPAGEFATFSCGCATEPGPGGCRCANS